jgi:hypothetical protein
MFPTASPDAYEIRILAESRTTAGADPNSDPGPYSPDGDLWLQLRETDPNDAGDIYGTGKVIGLVVVDKNDVSSSPTMVGGKIVDPNDPNTEIHPSMTAGMRYSVTAIQDPNSTVGGYHFSYRRIDGDGIVNGYQGTQAYRIGAGYLGVWTEVYDPNDPNADPNDPIYDPNYCYDPNNYDPNPSWSKSGSDTRIDDLIFEIKLIIPGDATGDHAVDVSDLGILAGNYYGTGKDWSTGDFTGEGNVDVSDLGILAGHYYEHLPEPTTIGLLALGGLSVLIRRRR